MRTFLLSKPILAILLMTFTLLNFSLAQNISVIHIQGDVKIENSTKKGKKSLVYGPMEDNSTITLKENNRVKLIRSKNEICDLAKPGSYQVNKLSFVNTGNNSILGRFCEYFHSFFTSNSSPESKATYQNSINAMSRGNMAVPSLDFPLQGYLSNEAGPIQFSWSHECDTCTYSLSIQEFSSKKVVFKTITKDKNVTIGSPKDYFVAGVKYYWKVEVLHQDLEYMVNSFTISHKGHFDESINGIAYRLDIQEFNWIEPTPKVIYVMSELSELKLPNYAVQYGQIQSAKYKDNKEIVEFTEAFLYNTLLKGSK